MTDLSPTAHRKTYRSSLTRDQIDEILHYAHIIPVSKGYTAAFMHKRYPQHEFNALMQVFRAAEILDRSAGMPRCRRSVAALHFTSTDSFEVDWAPAPEGARQTAATAERLDRLYGCGNLDAVFGDADFILCPWRRAGRLKAGDPVLDKNTAEVLQAPIWLSLVDPRRLWASQPRVLRIHAAYYLTGEWERTGITSADQHVAANRFPVIVPDRLGRLIIRTGHHRSLAALVEGRPLVCRLATAPPDGAVALTPRLLVGETSRLEHVVPRSAAEGVGLIRSGITIVCNEALARTIADRLGAAGGPQ